MTRITLVLALTAGLAAAVFVGLWSSSGASAAPFDGLKCYNARNVEQKGTPNQVVYISDQFEAKNLVIKKPLHFCSLTRTGIAGASTADISVTDLVCYAIKDAPNQPRFNQQRLETDDQFGSNSLLLTKPLSLCEPATKNLLEPGGSSAGPSETWFSFKCYQARRLEGDSPFEQISIWLSDQFEPDGKDVRLNRPKVFCTHVEEKKDRAENDNIEKPVHLTPGQEPETIHVSTIGATRHRTDPSLSCVDWYGHSVWYSVTVGPGVKAFTVETFDSTYDTVLGVFTGGPGKLDEVGCSDDVGGSWGVTSRVEVKPTSNQKYYVVVGAKGGAKAGKLKLQHYASVTCASNCAGAAAPASATSVDTGASAGVPPLEETGNLVCYSLSQRAPEATLLTTDQLYANIFDLGRGVMYCVPADKCVLKESGVDLGTGIAGCF